MSKHLMIAGPMIGSDLLVGFEFMPDRDYTACSICGAVYQHAFSRLNSSDITPASQHIAENCRREWSHAHSRTHTSTQHRQLALSGRKMTPEAAQILCTYGCIPVSDLALDEEHAHAGLLSPRIPNNDCQT